MAPIIMLIRHAEKALGDGPPHGVTIDGVQDRESLTPRGWQRAGALVAFFGGSAGPWAPVPASSPGLQAPSPAGPAPSPAGPAPSHLFASKVGVDSNSQRPRETLQPLAEKLGLAIDSRFLKLQLAELVEAIRVIDGVVLVAWEHRVIPSIARLITGDAARVPAAWPDDRYDLVWVFEPDASGSFGFRQIAQMLLAGDRADVVS